MEPNLVHDPGYSEDAAAWDKKMREANLDNLKLLKPPKTPTEPIEMDAAFMGRKGKKPTLTVELKEFRNGGSVGVSPYLSYWLYATDSDGKRVAELEWYDIPADATDQFLKENPDFPYIGWVNTQPVYARKGIATALYQRAKLITPGLKHSQSMSDLAKSWDKSMEAAGIDSPNVTDGWDPYAGSMVRTPTAREIQAMQVHPLRLLKPPKKPTEGFKIKSPTGRDIDVRVELTDRDEGSPNTDFDFSDGAHRLDAYAKVSDVFDDMPVFEDDDNEIHIAHIEWADEDPDRLWGLPDAYVTSVMTEDHNHNFLRRQGIATALWQRAKLLTPSLVHDPSYSQDARAWDTKMREAGIDSDVADIAALKLLKPPSRVDEPIKLKDGEEFAVEYARDTSGEQGLENDHIIRVKDIADDPKWGTRKVIASLRWRDEGKGPYVAYVYTMEEHRAKGIATAMWQRAKLVTPDLSHDNNISEHALRWAQKMEDAGIDSPLPADAEYWTEVAVRRRAQRLRESIRRDLDRSRGVQGDVAVLDAFENLSNLTLLKPPTKADEAITLKDGKKLDVTYGSMKPAHLIQVTDRESRKTVGHLRWHNAIGSDMPAWIQAIEVNPVWRGKGIATAMWLRAQLVTPELHHSDEISDDAIAWSEKMQAAGIKSPHVSDMWALERNGSLSNLTLLKPPTKATDPIEVDGKKYRVQVEDMPFKSMLTVWDGDKRIGHIEWMGDKPPFVSGVHTDEPLRGKGIATALWLRAKILEPRLVHSSLMSDDAIAWDKKMDAAGIDSPNYLSNPTQDEVFLSMIGKIEVDGFYKHNKKGQLVWVKPHTRTARKGETPTFFVSESVWPKGVSEKKLTPAQKQAIAKAKHDNPGKPSATQKAFKEADSKPSWWDLPRSSHHYLKAKAAEYDDYDPTYDHTADSSDIVQRLKNRMVLQQVRLDDIDRYKKTGDLQGYEKSYMEAYLSQRPAFVKKVNEHRKLIETLKKGAEKQQWQKETSKKWKSELADMDPDYKRIIDTLGDSLTIMTVDPDAKEKPKKLSHYDDQMNPVYVGGPRKVNSVEDLTHVMQHLNELARVPDEIMKKMVAKDYKIVLGEKMFADEMDPFQKGRKARGWGGKTMKRVPGFFSPSQKILYAGHHKNHGSRSMALHEWGHAYDHYLGRPSEESTFMTHHKKIKKLLTPYYRQQKGAGASEFFAELFGLLAFHDILKLDELDLDTPEGNNLLIQIQQRVSSFQSFQAHNDWFKEEDEALQKLVIQIFNLVKATAGKTAEQEDEGGAGFDEEGE